MVYHKVGHGWLLSFWGGAAGTGYFLTGDDFLQKANNIVTYVLMGGIVV